MKEHLEFEKPIIEVEDQIAQLQDLAKNNPRTLEEVRRLEKKAAQLREEIYANLTPWQKTQIARHPNRPNTLDYIEAFIEDFIELHGDRLFGDDPSIVGGIGKLDGRSVVIIGQQKGKTVKERIHRNFGMPHPEGYRKALRLMLLAEKFNKPIITLIDTPGAYPGVGAEERGQSEAIARNLMVMSTLSVPIIAVIIGEGGSGGALALGVGDRTLMLQHAIYSVASPEACAAILWSNSARAPEAAEALKITANDLQILGIVDEIIQEPLGGAHRDHPRTIDALRKALFRHLTELSETPVEALLDRRYARYKKIGTFQEEKTG
jgi:acetyl-CoA carboxylase carboxyl transferase subunit alpha